MTQNKNVCGYSAEFNLVKYSATFNQVLVEFCDYNFISNELGEKIVFDNFELPFKRYDYLINEDKGICSLNEKDSYWANIEKTKYSAIIENCPSFKYEDIQHLIQLFPKNPTDLKLGIPPSPSPTPSITPTISHTPSVTPTISHTPSVTPTISHTPSVTPTISHTSSVTPTVSHTPSATITPSPSYTLTPTPTPSATTTPSVTITPSPSYTLTPTPTPSATTTPSVTITPSPSYTLTLTPTPSATTTPSVTITPSPSHTLTPTPTPSATTTPSVTYTPSISLTPTLTPSKTATPSVTPSISTTPSITPTVTPTPTVSSLMPDWEGWTPEEEISDVVRNDETAIVFDEEGRVTQWGDDTQSTTTFLPPSNIEKYPTYTTLNGRPAINFDGREDGDGDYLDTFENTTPLYTGDGVADRILDDGFAIFIVGEQNAETDGFGNYDRGSIFRHSDMWINSHAPWDNGALYFDIGLPGYCYGAEGSDQATCELNGGEWQTMSRIQSNQWLKDHQGNSITQHQFIAQWTYDVQNTKQQVFKNGEIIAEGIADRIIHISPNSSIRLAQAGWHQKVVMGEVIILDFYPDESERQKIEGYLAHKWNMTYLLSESHPFKLSPPN